ncbi:uncharacterized protein KIAA1211-like isoform X2 [Parambassis ranga]|nr:uncharacterized protein KIAA1211-like homolog isoform X2 [Parambassis ranga]
MMGSRALSHDSIFLADQVLTGTEPARVLSQENVQSKIKALQMKLQLQKMHLGPPPMVLPVKRPEDLSSHSEENITSEEDLVKTISQPASCPLSPIPKPALTKSLPPTPSHMLCLSVPSHPSAPSPSVAAEPPLDFSTPAQFTPCLDTSAARHRMSIKPRNQRASTKKKVAVTQSERLVNTLNNIDHPESAGDEEQQLDDEEELNMETELPAEAAPVPSQAAPKPSILSPLPGTAAGVAPPILRVKPQRRVDARFSERPHSSFIESELRERRDAEFDVKVTSQTDAEQSSAPFSSVVALRSLQAESDTPKGIQRPALGSGSFHFTTAKHQDGERPRSGSFIEVLQQTEGRQKTGGGTEERSLREKEDVRGVQTRGGPFAVGRLRQEAAPPKTPATPWDRRDSLKKAEPVTTSKNVPTDVAAAEEEEEEVMEEAVEAKQVHEDEGKVPFGIKLRSTSQSFRLRSDITANHHTKTTQGEEQGDRQTRQEISDHTDKLPANMAASGDLSPTDPAPSGSSPPINQNTPDRPPPDVHTPPSAPKAAESPPQEPQAAPPEVSWMSLAMEKTRSLQQLFTSRFPRDFTGMQTAGRQTGPAEPAAGTQHSAVQAAQRPSSESQTVKPVQQQRASPVHTNKDPQMSQQPPEDQTHTAQSCLRWSSQAETTSPSLAPSNLPSGQQPSWTSRSLRSTAASSAAAPPSGREAAAVQKEAPSTRRAVWGSSVSERAAFLEKRADGATAPGPKGVDVRKPQTEAQPSGEPLSLTHPGPLSKDPVPAEGRPGLKAAESSPIRDPDRWLRKNVAPPSSPSSSPMQPSDSGQPSWMELAKRKSMAWSDKTMD